MRAYPKTISPGRYIILLTGLIIFLPLFGQNIPNTRNLPNIEFEHLGENQDLVKIINCLYQDSRGFMWIGTAVDGLYRYDGYEFKRYNYQYDDSTSLSENYVTDFLFEDSSGDIWITCMSGECNRYNRSSDDFTRFVHRPGDPNSLPMSSISSITEDPDGNMWLAYSENGTEEPRGGLYRLERKSGKLTAYRNDPGDPGSLAANCLSELFIDSKGSLWIGTGCGHGVDKFIQGQNGEPDKFKHYAHASGDSADPILSSVVGIIEDQKGSLWFGTNGEGILRYSKEKDLLERYWIVQDPSGVDNIVTAMSLDMNGDLWLGTDGGLARYDPIVDTFRIYHHDPADENSIAPGSVKIIAPDPEGLLWFATGAVYFRDGINRFDPSTGRSVRFQHDPNDPGSLSSNEVWSAIIDRSGILWIGTMDRWINRFDPHKKKFNVLKPVPYLSIHKPIEKVYSVIEDYAGILWIGTFSQGLFRYDRSTGELTNFKYDPKDPGSSISGNTIITICEDSPGILWLGGVRGMNRLDTKTMEFRHFLHDPNDPKSLGANQIQHIIRDRSGILWIGTLSAGLNRFNPQTEEFKSFLPTPHDPESLEWGYGILSVYEDSHGNIWASGFNGLYKYTPGRDGQSDSLVHYTHDENNPNSLSINSVQVVLEDDSGKIWIGTLGGGLNKLDPETGLFKVYTMADGLPSSTVWCIVPDERGRLWLSTTNGLSRFDPETGEFDNYNISDGLQSMDFSFNASFRRHNGEIFFAGEKGINCFFPDKILENSNIPNILIVDFKLFNRSLRVGENSPLKKAITEVREIELKHDQNFLSFEFTALNYTNTSKNQYKYRMIGLNPDTVFAGTRRYAEFQGMKPGRYTFWVTGSNNDGVWNEEGRSIQIIIHPPWWKRNLAYVLYFLIILLLIAGFIRWRTFRLKKDKERLERQVQERTHEIEEKDKHILEMDRMKTRFFANISHEFRTPITLILNPVEEMISDKVSKIKDYVKLDVIRRNGIRLLELVNRLLDLSKLDSGKLKLELVESDIIGTLRLTYSSFLSLAEKRNIQYHFQLPEDELMTYFDRGKLVTIMNNLLSNAFKYTSDGGEVRCAVITGEKIPIAHPKELKITVSDSGPGIPENKLDLIFDRFYQADEHRSIDGGGTGIGLSLTKELVHLIHGKIEVESIPGEGTSFIVTLPLGKDHLKESEFVIMDTAQDAGEQWSKAEQSEDLETDFIADPQSNEKPDNGSDQLLIVEDNTELRSYIKEQFQKEYLIEEAADGEEGIRKAAKRIPDLIITDIMMPGMDGMEFCTRIKTNERTSHIPVIMLTARADTESRIEGLEQGADDYLIKPFNIEELKTRVENLIVGRRNLRKRFASGLDNALKDIPFNSYDLKFIRRIMELIEMHLDDFEFGVKELQSRTGMSQTQLYRKLFALTGMSPSTFIRHLRLRKAAAMLEQNDKNVTDVAFSVGFNNLSYFAKCFREQYGISPSDYHRQFSK